MTRIATFHTHFGAMTFRDHLLALGDATAVMMPVPRALSASCGVCVRFEAEFDPDTMFDEDLEKVVLVDGQGYQTLFENDS